MVDVKLNVDVQGRSLSEFGKLIERRQKFLGETTDASVTACALDLLRSLRAQTKTASAAKTKIKLEAMPSLSVSFTSHGGKRRLCMRAGNIRFIPPTGIRQIFTPEAIKNPRAAKVWKWIYKPLNHPGQTTYLIAAPSRAAANRLAKGIVKRKTARMKGLGRAVFSMLMRSLYAAANENASGKIQAVAAGFSSVRKYVSGNSYNLDLLDGLSYAELALKGGVQSLATAAMKAANKTASVINRKCRNLLDFIPIQTPFPEVRKISK